MPEVVLNPGLDIVKAFLHKIFACDHNGDDNSRVPQGEFTSGASNMTFLPCAVGRDNG